MLIETANLAFGLLAPILLYVAVVSLVTSPWVVVGWALGYGREIFADQSEGARFARAHHIVVTAMAVAGGWVLLS